MQDINLSLQAIELKQFGLLRIYLSHMKKTDINKIFKEPKKFLYPEDTTLLLEAMKRRCLTSIEILVAYGADLNQEKPILPVIQALTINKSLFIFLVAQGAQVSSARLDIFPSNTHNPLFSKTNNLLAVRCYYDNFDLNQFLLLRIMIIEEDLEEHLQYKIESLQKAIAHAYTFPENPQALLKERESVLKTLQKSATPFEVINTVDLYQLWRSSTYCLVKKSTFLNTVKLILLCRSKNQSIAGFIDRIIVFFLPYLASNGQLVLPNVGKRDFVRSDLVTILRDKSAHDTLTTTLTDTNKPERKLTYFEYSLRLRLK